MASQKPALLFIPGAWHTPEYFTDVIGKLKAYGYETHALQLPSVGGVDTTTATDDAAFIQKTTASLVEEGKDVLIIMHSYGGIPGTESAKGFLKTEREAAGKKGGIVGLVYIAALLIAEGQTLGSFIGGMPDWITFDRNRMTLNRITDVMYNDLPVEVAEAYAKKVLHHAAPSFYTPLTYPAYQHLPTTYLLCKKDQALPFVAQQAMAAIGGEAVTIHVCNSSHSPMLSMPDTVVSVIRQAAEVVSSIGLRIKDGKPPIDELLEDLWLPEQFMERPGEFCDCVQWVWGVIYNYSGLDCIETVSTTGISRDDLVQELVRRQSDALIGIEMGLALSKLACTKNYGSQEIRSNDHSGSHPGANPGDTEVDDGK